jgi:hypothetical protein
MPPQPSFVIDLRHENCEIELGESFYGRKFIGDRGTVG